jgi:hypothetical protein
MTVLEDSDTAREIADEVVDHFSTLHPHIRLNRQEWHDLHEMIEREVLGHYGTEPQIGASDLLKWETPH